MGCPGAESGIKTDAPVRLDRAKTYSLLVESAARRWLQSRYIYRLYIGRRCIFMKSLMYCDGVALSGRPSGWDGNTMNRFQRILLLVLCLVILMGAVHLAPTPSASAASTCGKTTRWNVNLERDLRDIGDVYVWNTDDNILHIRPVLLYGWHMQESWMDVRTYFGGFPRNADGTFNYGAFLYHRTHSPIVREDYYALRFRSSWLTGTEMHIALRLDMVKLNSYGQVIDRAVAWGYQKAVGPAMYLKHVIQTCLDLSQYQGCKTYYWSSSTKLYQWAYTSRTPNDSFNLTFQRNAFSPDITLRQALYLSDNGLARLAKHAVGALLNAEHPGVNYPYSVGEVFQKFWQSYDTRNYAAAANVFYEANWLTCPLP